MCQSHCGHLCVSVVNEPAEIVSVFSKHGEFDFVAMLVLGFTHSSPEVILGLPLSEAIDMWGLGCVLLYLYLAYHPFAVNCRYQGVSIQICVIL